MALKPDVTLSIVRNSADQDDCVRKVYYNESVYRRPKGSRSFREITQVGLECMGDVDDYCVSEVLYLAAKSLLAVSEDCVLAVSHLGIVSDLMDRLGLNAEKIRTSCPCFWKARRTSPRRRRCGGLSPSAENRRRCSRS